MIEKVRKKAEGMYKERNWKYHIVIVVKHALHLARTEGADKEVVELAALLHDIGRTIDGDEGHDIRGVPVAEKILADFGYGRDVIARVTHCILTHRASRENKAETKEALIIRDADALAHFDVILLFIGIGLEKFGDLQTGLDWLEKKLDRDWNTKIHFEESRRIGEEKYNAARLLIDSMNEWF